jgi:hypothetical protein
MLHLHITSWIVGILLALYVGHGYSKGQNVKVPHMILRLIYLIILGTGLYVFIKIPKDNMPTNLMMLYNIKMTAGIIMLGIFEFFTISSKKGRKMLVPSVVFGLLLLVLLYLGFRLPMGFQFFGK